MKMVIVLNFEHYFLIKGMVIGVDQIRLDYYAQCLYYLPFKPASVLSYLRPDEAKFLR